MCQFIICYCAKLLKLGTMELGIEDDIELHLFSSPKRETLHSENTWVLPPSMKVFLEV
jgi:hypothetical protein